MDDRAAESAPSLEELQKLAEERLQEEKAVILKPSWDLLLKSQWSPVKPQMDLPNCRVEVATVPGFPRRAVRMIMTMTCELETFLAFLQDPGNRRDYEPSLDQSETIAMTPASTTTHTVYKSTSIISARDFVTKSTTMKMSARECHAILGLAGATLEPSSRSNSLSTDTAGKSSLSSARREDDVAGFVTGAINSDELPPSRSVVRGEVFCFAYFAVRESKRQSVGAIGSDAPPAGPRLTVVHVSCSNPKGSLPGFLVDSATVTLTCERLSLIRRHCEVVERVQRLKTSSRYDVESSESPASTSEADDRSEASAGETRQSVGQVLQAPIVASVAVVETAAAPLPQTTAVVEAVECVAPSTEAPKEESQPTSVVAEESASEVRSVALQPIQVVHAPVAVVQEREPIKVEEEIPLPPVDQPSPVAETRSETVDGKSEPQLVAVESTAAPESTTTAIPVQAVNPEPVHQRVEPEPKAVPLQTRHVDPTVERKPVSTALAPVPAPAPAPPQEPVVVPTPKFKPTPAQRVLLSNLITLYENPEWKMGRVLQNCLLEDCAVANCKLKAVRISTDVNCSLETLSYFLKDEAMLRKTDPTLDQLSVLAEKDEVVTVYSSYKQQVKLISPRDFCTSNTTVLLPGAEAAELGLKVPPGHRVLIQACATPTPELTRLLGLGNRLPSARKEFTRGTILAYGYIAFESFGEEPSKGVGSDRTPQIKLYSIASVDPGGSIPTWLVDAGRAEGCKKVAEVRGLLQRYIPPKSLVKPAPKVQPRENAAPPAKVAVVAETKPQPQPTPEPVVSSRQPEEVVVHSPPPTAVAVESLPPVRKEVEPQPIQAAAPSQAQEPVQQHATFHVPVANEPTPGVSSEPNPVPLISGAQLSYDDIVELPKTSPAQEPSAVATVSAPRDETQPTEPVSSSASSAQSQSQSQSFSAQSIALAADEVRLESTMVLPTVAEVEEEEEAFSTFYTPEIESICQPVIDLHQKSRWEHLKHVDTIKVESAGTSSSDQLVSLRLSTEFMCTLETFIRLVQDLGVQKQCDGNIDSLRILHSPPYGQVLHTTYRKGQGLPRRDSCTLIVEHTLSESEGSDLGLYSSTIHSTAFLIGVGDTTDVQPSMGMERWRFSGSGFIAIATPPSASRIRVFQLVHGQVPKGSNISGKPVDAIATSTAQTFQRLKQLCAMGAHGVMLSPPRRSQSPTRSTSPKRTASSLDTKPSPDENLKALELERKTRAEETRLKDLVLHATEQAQISRHFGDRRKLDNGCFVEEKAFEDAALLQELTKGSSSAGKSSSSSGKPLLIRVTTEFLCTLEVFEKALQSLNTVTRYDITVSSYESSTSAGGLLENLTLRFKSAAPVFAGKELHLISCGRAYDHAGGVAAGLYAGIRSSAFSKAAVSDLGAARSSGAPNVLLFSFVALATPPEATRVRVSHLVSVEDVPLGKGPSKAKDSLIKWASARLAGLGVVCAQMEKARLQRLREIAIAPPPTPEVVAAPAVTEPAPRANTVTELSTPPQEQPIAANATTPPAEAHRPVVVAREPETKPEVQQVEADQPVTEGANRPTSEREEAPLVPTVVAEPKEVESKPESEATVTRIAEPEVVRSRFEVAEPERVPERSNQAQTGQPTEEIVSAKEPIVDHPVQPSLTAPLTPPPPPAPPAISSAQKQVLTPLIQLHNRTDWKMGRVIQGCLLEDCPVPYSKVKAVRISTEVNCSLESLNTFLQDEAMLRKTDPALDALDVISNVDGVITVYSSYKQQVRLIAARDFCSATTRVLLDPVQAQELGLRGPEVKQGPVLLSGAVNSTARPAKAGSSYVRGFLHCFGYLGFSGAAPGRQQHSIKLVMIALVEPGGSIPGWVIEAAKEDNCKKLALIKKLLESG
jgi:hypothetical protein